MIQVIVEDFVGKAAGDPRVNFTRKGTGQEWDPTPANVGKLKEHLVEFSMRPRAALRNIAAATCEACIRPGCRSPMPSLMPSKWTCNRR